jgi:trehalose 6-phosphate phosphatase
MNNSVNRQILASALEPQSDMALFLDVDGTLIDIAETPYSVRIPGYLAHLLEEASRNLGGALAIVSGRTLSAIDSMLAPLNLPCAGEHGAIMRLPDSAIQTAPDRCVIPESWRERVRHGTSGWNGVIVEYKPYSLAVHYRVRPEHGPEVRKLLQSIVQQNEVEFEVLPARMAYEIRHRAMTKGFAVRQFMKFPNFRGRVPVFVGDDITDDDGFKAVTEMGGVALHVDKVFGGKPENVRRWLERFGTLDEAAWRTSTLLQ